MTKVAGKCPMGCGETLFLGDGGHVTCSFNKCPNPGMVDEMLHREIIILKRPIQKLIVAVDE